MSKRIFTSKQILELLKNKAVAKCSEKSITYSNPFKLKAVELYGQGLSSSEIFRQSGFDLQVIGKKIPIECLKRWNRKYKATGTTGLSIETRGRGRGGGRPKTKGLTDANKIKSLEMEVAYLKAENDFLAKLRADKKR